MSHLDYYKFQAEARGVRSIEDVRRIASERTHVYDRLVLRWLPDDRTKPVAELACGHGSLLCWLKEKNFAAVTAVDSSPSQIAFARKTGANVDENDVNRWLAGQPQNHFAAIIAIDLVEHLAKDDFMTLLRSAHAALAPAGSLILRLPNGDSPLVGMNLFNDITHVWTYTPNCLNSLAQMHGFARTEFADESAEAVRDYRWLKVPLAKLSGAILRVVLWAATRERIQQFSPHLWARLIK